MNWLDDPDFIELLNACTKQMRNEIERLRDQISDYEKLYDTQSQIAYCYKFAFIQERQSNLIFEESLKLTALLENKYPLKVVYSPN